MDANFLTDLAARTRELREQGLYKNERILVSPQNAAIRVEAGARSSTSAPTTTSDWPTTPGSSSLRARR